MNELPPANVQPKGRHERGYLPHCDFSGRAQAVTFRLADSLPKDVIEKALQNLEDDDDRRKRYQTLLDSSLGSCALRGPTAAHAVMDALLFGHDTRYRLFAWVVMPNHVHVLFQPHPAFSMSAIVKGWKSVTSRQIQGKGQLWAPDYFDRMIRDSDHHDTC